MLMPCVTRSEVTPPSVPGQYRHTAVSTSAARALMLRTLMAASMAEAAARYRAGATASVAPAGPNALLRDDRQADLVEVREEQGCRQGARDGGSDDRAAVGGGHRVARLGETHRGRRPADVVAG